MPVSPGTQREPAAARGSSDPGVGRESGSLDEGRRSEVRDGLRLSETVIVELAPRLPKTPPVRHDLDSDPFLRAPASTLSGPWARATAEEGRPRILLYSHDSFGLGHLRRSLTLAAELAQAFPEASLLLVTGSPCATFFDLPPRVGLVKLPSVTKDESGAYAPRGLPGSLSFTLRLRRGLIQETFRTYEPDLLIVDHQVVGLLGEMLGVLREAKKRGTRTILGVRDVIDSPEVVAREWGSDDCRWALSEGYDRVCVYGAPEVFDARHEYPIPPELGERLEFTGYVVRPSAHLPFRPVPSLRPQVLVTMGGGEDGAERIDAYLSALELEPSDWESVVVAGPLLDTREARRLRRRAEALGSVRLHRFHADLPHLLAQCQAVVSMAGYNTCAEILRSRRPSVLLPRTWPRLEQRIRAERLAALGLTDVPELEPIQVRRAIERALARGGVGERMPNLDGARRVSEIAGELLSLPVRPFVRRSHSPEALVS